LRLRPKARIRPSRVKKKPLGSDQNPRGVLGGTNSHRVSGTLPDSLFPTYFVRRRPGLSSLVGGVSRSQRPGRRRKVWDRHPLTRGPTVLDAGAPMARAIAFRKTAVPKKPFSPHKNTNTVAGFRDFSDGMRDSRIDSCPCIRLGLRLRGCGGRADGVPGRGRAA
jgi:hypothetical protein